MYRTAMSVIFYGSLKVSLADLEFLSQSPSRIILLIAVSNKYNTLIDQFN